VAEIWQIFALQSACPAFTPTFQAPIPDILPKEARCTRALSLSRLAYDLETARRPGLTALQLAFMPSGTLFSARRQASSPWPFRPRPSHRPSRDPACRAGSMTEPPPAPTSISPRHCRI
jgi:hypothetical protein